MFYKSHDDVSAPPHQNKPSRPLTASSNSIPRIRFHCEVREKCAALWTPVRAQFTVTLRSFAWVSPTTNSGKRDQIASPFLCVFVPSCEPYFLASGSIAAGLMRLARSHKGTKNQFPTSATLDFTVTFGSFLGKMERSAMATRPRHPELVSGSTVTPYSAAKGEALTWMPDQVRHDGEVSLLPPCATNRHVLVPSWSPPTRRASKARRASAPHIGLACRCCRPVPAGGHWDRRNRWI
jgi:hypothetical protein